ncbi:hypothetical protein DAPPUDRAFT_307542 [Daphnia pulex]|uniref:Sulfhydryl oxidase n=1 Tax=Daphnia pulex TaxID=6669 RepID=E9H339_DAPPU|nr:hypothetical protein DAPPUDRAFT_307542 [Daphnia pulex]|eukprot:EFX73902.1 hypothetical protein DAPPUDRAFT_307542 [Daphnia pulex]
MASQQSEDFSPHGNQGIKKPCRTCSDFKTWTTNLNQNANVQEKMNSQISQSTGAETKSSFRPTIHTVEKTFPECPLDRQQLGRNSWSVLHTIAAYYPETPTVDQQKDMVQFMALFTKFYPCTDCSEDFKERLIANPPATQNNSILSQWLCAMHNEVNVKLGKPEFDCNLVNQRWRNGWKDGSCD